MAAGKMKKINLIFARDELDPFLGELILLGVVDVLEPALLDEDPELSPAVRSEPVDLEHYGANRKTLTLLGTEYTLYLTGWFCEKSEDILVKMVAKHTCAWEIIDPTYEEQDSIPRKLLRPKFLHRFYKGSRKLFSPLGYGAYQPSKNADSPDEYPENGPDSPEEEYRYDE